MPTAPTSTELAEVIHEMCDQVRDLYTMHPNLHTAPFIHRWMGRQTTWLLQFLGWYVTISSSTNDSPATRVGTAVRSMFKLLSQANSTAAREELSQLEDNSAWRQIIYP